MLTAWKLSQVNLITFVLVDSAGAEVAGLGTAWTLQISKAGGAFAGSAGTKAEMANGGTVIWRLQPKPIQSALSASRSRMVRLFSKTLSTLLSNAPSTLSSSPTLLPIASVACRWTG